MISYGLPVVWCALITMALDASGRYFLNYYNNLEQVGFYSIAVKIANIFQMLITRPFGTAWGGLIFQIVRWPNARLIFSKTLSYVWALSLLAALVLSVFTPALFAIFATPAYLPATVVFPLLLLVRAVNIMEYPTAVGLYVSDRTRRLVPIYLVGLVVNIAMNFALVPAYGMLGAGWSWLLAWLVIICLLAWVGQRYYPLSYDWKLLLLPTVPWGLVLFGQDRFMPGLSRLHWTLQIAFAALVALGIGALLVRDLRLTQRQISLEKANQ
jgi:O-antigen/teichoic acid export membrane protein